MKKSLVSKVAFGAAALAAAGTLSVPTFASAQSYYGDRYDGRYDRRYDDCSYRDSRTAGGALIGGALGAVAGSQIAARGHRSDGSLVGGVLGAVVGGAIGNNSANCGYDSRYRYDDGRRYYSDSRYNDGYYSDSGYDDRYDDRYNGGYYTSYPSSSYYSSGSSYYGDSYGYSDGHGYSDCRTVQRSYRLPGGRYQTRTEQVCR